MTKASHDEAVITALTAFAFLGEDSRRLQGLFDLTGLTPDDGIAALQGQDSAFLGAILDYLMSVEAWAEEFCKTNDILPETLASAAHALGAGPLMT